MKYQPCGKLVRDWEGGVFPKIPVDAGTRDHGWSTVHLPAKPVGGKEQGNYVPLGSAVRTNNV